MVQPGLKVETSWSRSKVKPDLPELEVEMDHFASMVSCAKDRDEPTLAESRA